MAETQFGNSVAQFYEEFMVPMIFAPYADNMVARSTALPALDILETAAGTGIVTRKLADETEDDIAIVATDISQPMLDLAAHIGTRRPVEWEQADAVDLPFRDQTFDQVLCQFGVMFFHDRVQAYRETFRVLRPGGSFIFNAWDKIVENEFVDTAQTAVAAMFPDNPPTFLPTIPHGYWDQMKIAADLKAGGFTSKPSFSVLAHKSVAPSPAAAARAYCTGTPLRAEIEARDPNRLEEAVSRAETDLAAKFGTGRIEGKIQAIIVQVTR